MIEKKDNFNLVYLRYWFMKTNIEIDISKIIDDLWVLKYWYLTILKESIDSKNRINFDNIDLSPSNTRILIALFKRKWFIWKYKLKGDSVKNYYLNPLYAHKGKTISNELYVEFNDTNEWKIY